VSKNRKALTKRVRFDVFKRDVFVCQYCGATPPSAILHADHVIAVAEGGGNEYDNLITACSDCNLGKGARALSSLPTPLRDRAAELAEREEQLRAYDALLAEKRQLLLRNVQVVSDIYEARFYMWKLSDSSRLSIRRFLEKLPLAEVADAMEIACSRVGSGAVFNYFCGICWSKIRERGFRG
jgi:hypothetical protein